MGSSQTWAMGQLRPRPLRGRERASPVLSPWAPVVVASPRLATLVGPLQGTPLPEGTRLAATRPVSHTLQLRTEPCPGKLPERFGSARWH
jgi:hypothetical protein